MTATTRLTDLDARKATADWLGKFEATVSNGDIKAAAGLFVADSHWRDLLSFTWHIETTSGAAAIEAALRRTVPAIRPRGFRIAQGSTGRL